jgi:uncharacterized membrane protein
MAITFLEKRKFQKNLMIVFLILVLVFLFVLWRVFWAEKKLIEYPAQEEVLKPFKKVEIDFKNLENPLLKELIPFEQIKPFEVTAPTGEKIGRENPFLPYSPLKR